MFKSIFLFEFKYRFRQPATYLYFLFFVLVGLCFTGIEATYFGPPVSGKIFKNSPFVLANLIIGGSFFSLFIVASLMGTSLFKDQKFKTEALFYTTPLSKPAYFWGRFLSSYLICCLVFSGLVIGAMLGCLLPHDPSKYAPFLWSSYWQPLVYLGFTNYFFFACIFYGAYALSKNSLVIYLGGVTLYVLYIISSILSEQIADYHLANLLDPMGWTAWFYTTQYWTIAQKNHLLLPLREYIFINRVLWCGIGLGFLILSFLRFKMNTQTKERKKKTGSAATLKAPAIQRIRISIDYSLKTTLSQFRAATRIYMGFILRSWVFWAITSFGLAIVLFNGYFLSQNIQTSYPVTYQILSLVGDNFLLFVLIIIIIYTGELVWRERDLKMQGISDTFPLSNAVLLFSKVLSLVLIMGGVLVMLLLAGICIQLAYKFPHIDFGQYAMSFLMQWSTYAQLIALSIAIHLLVNNRYVAYAIVTIFYVAFFIAPEGLGIEHLMLKYSSPVPFVYSDMNGYGQFKPELLLTHLYYLSIAFIFLFFSWAFWVRGEESSFKSRWNQFQILVRHKGAYVLALLLFFLIASGFTVFYNTNVLNTYYSTKDIEKRLAETEKRYSRFNDKPFPKVIAIDLHADLHPENRYYRLSGKLWLKNTGKLPLHELLLKTIDDKNGVYNLLSFSKAAHLDATYSSLGYALYHFDRALSSGDSLSVYFDYTYKPQGFKSRVSDQSDFSWASIDLSDQITANGTFISTLPVDVGYDKSVEIKDESKRKKYGLGKYKEIKTPDSSISYSSNLFNSNSDGIRLTAVVTTAPDQIAMAPGRLISDHMVGGRREFTYRSERSIADMVSILSARYQIKEGTWMSPDHRIIRIAIYYDNHHPFNLESMMAGAKAALTYNSKSFSPYQFSELRILEFPRYKSFAQSFPNTVPFSESAGFISDIRNQDKVNDVFYITAHEVSHQWWGHQVEGADVLGSNILSENLADYSALMALEHAFGTQKISILLRSRMLKMYLRGRAAEKIKERTLIYADPGESYLMYGKGPLAMYQMKDYLGEATFDSILRHFMLKYQYRKTNYPTTLNLLQEIKAGTPDSLQFLVHDLFETISLFDNRIDSASYTALPGGKYKVDITVESHKFLCDSLGNEKAIAGRQWIDIGIFGTEKSTTKYYDAAGKPLLLKKVLIEKPVEFFSYIVNEKPYKAGIDPYGKLLDKIIDDNLKVVEKKK